MVSIVTKLSEGWRTTVAVFQGVKPETLERRFPFPEFDIEEIEIEKNLKNWPEEE